MLDCFKMKKIGIFAGGVLFGTAGVKILASKDAKKFCHFDPGERRRYSG